MNAAPKTRPGDDLARWAEVDADPPAVAARLDAWDCPI